MKKVILLGLVGVLASCSMNDESVEKLNSKEIQFATLNDKNTRAANANGDDYVVLASASSGTNWFINDQFNGSGADVDKPKEGKIFHWPAQGSVDFWAYAPASVNATRHYASRTATIEYEVNANADQDLTIASPLLGKTIDDGVVAFTFKHVLSRVEVDAKLSDKLLGSNYTIHFDSVAIGVNQNKGEISITENDPTWLIAPGTTPAQYDGAKKYMILPQNGKDITIQLKGVTITKGMYVIVDNVDMKPFTLTGTTNDIVKFEPGFNYKIAITVKSSSTDANGDMIFGTEIEFSSTVEPWGNANFTSN